MHFRIRSTDSHLHDRLSDQRRETALKRRGGSRIASALEWGRSNRRVPEANLNGTQRADEGQTRRAAPWSEASFQPSRAGPPPRFASLALVLQAVAFAFARFAAVTFGVS